MTKFFKFVGNCRSTKKFCHFQRCVKCKWIKVLLPSINTIMSQANEVMFSNLRIFVIVLRRYGTMFQIFAVRLTPAIWRQVTAFAVKVPKPANGVFAVFKFSGIILSQTWASLLFSLKVIAIVLNPASEARRATLYWL